MRKKVSTILSIVAAIASLIVALLVLQSILKPHHLKIMTETLQSFGKGKIIAGLLVSLISYLIMIGYDYLALQLYRINIPFQKVALTSLISDTINANVGFSAIVGSLIRGRRYSKFGCSFKQIVKVIAAITTAYWFGFGVVFFIVFLADTTNSLITKSVIFKIIPVGAILITTLIGVLLWVRKHYEVSERKRIYTIFLLLGIVGICDWIAATSAFIILSPSHLSPSRLAVAYLIAHFIGNISQAPGGIAVFESAFLLAAKTTEDVGVVGASLVMFRLIYLIIPFLIGLFLFAYEELKSIKRKKRAEETNKNIEKSQNNMPQLVSVVIPAYNEEATIQKCITSVKNQSYKGEYEIIVVDNASTDRTAEIARQNGCKIIYEPNKGYYNALKTGFSAAKGDIIACTDADSIVPEDWLERFVNILSNPKNGACSGVFGFHDGPFWLKILGNIFGLLNWHLAGANMAVRKDIFIKVGGFSPSVTMGTDVELGLRISKISRLIIDRKNRVLTSSRRFECAFFRTLVRYYLNDLFLFLFKKPLFHGFKDYRQEHVSMLSRRRMIYSASIFLVATILGLGYSLQRPKSVLMGYVFSHVKKHNTKKIVALTFDDGPGASTDTILDILKKYDIKATFFVVGKNVLQYPEKIRKIAEDGHEIGNHSFSHSSILELENRKKIGKEISLTNEIIKELTGKVPKIFRPPHGWRSPWMLKEIENQNLITVTWDISSDDWMGLSSKIISSNVIKKVKPGSIILMHDRLATNKKDKMRTNLIEALPIIIEGLRVKGYYFVTISEMLEYSPESTEVAAYREKDK